MLAAGEVADQLAGGVGEADVGERGVRLPRAHAVQRGEVADVLPHGQVVVDARRLGDVADAVAQTGGAGRLAEHGDLAGADLLHARRARA